MGKASRRKREQAAHSACADVHQRIAQEAQRARSAPDGLADDGYPELAKLLRTAQAEVLRSAPRQISYEGRTYWCRVSHGMSLIELFDSPISGTPLARTICGSTDLAGHQPAH